MMKVKLQSPLLSPRDLLPSLCRRASCGLLGDTGKQPRPFSFWKHLAHGEKRYNATGIGLAVTRE